ncbi:sporulation protein Cse60 [Viridibacillus sp. YIM B01967]|uniref:Sporulation protein Cse60 n=1 Tax=Viridibacillus soli TaxID=2798301 RepID=A0ABS1H360_9BACL|nr:sporulation protein Cse60 [Viridibacillus soli]MBK3493855.1 sporulation protein Cse60 [Viridibacillus soli]
MLKTKEIKTSDESTMEEKLNEFLSENIKESQLVDIKLAGAGNQSCAVGSFMAIVIYKA